MKYILNQIARFLSTVTAPGKLDRKDSALDFRALADNLPDVVVRYDRDCRRTYVNPALERYTGLPAHAALGKSPLEHWLVPGNSSVAIAFQDKLIKVLEAGQPEAWEQTWTDEEGNVVCMDFRAVPEFDRYGRSISVLTVARDISSKRIMQQYQRMAAGVFETAHEGIMITDPDGRILDVNPAFVLISGFRRNEVVGQRPSILSSGRHTKEFYASMWSALKSDGVWNGEVINRRKCGEIYTERLGITTVRDANGVVSHYVGIFTDISHIKLREQHLQFLAYHDALTGLPNRLLLTDRMQQAIAQVRRVGGQLAILYLDLDGFKPINDSHGHEVGDLVLAEIAKRMSGVVRASDTVARLGGDEFVALLVERSGKNECGSVARRVLDAISRPINVERLEISMSASIGISLYPSDNSDPDTLLRYADMAMYCAKSTGRNQYVFHHNNVVGAT